METSDGISIPMKNLINDYYVKDLSKKVRVLFIADRKRVNLLVHMLYLDIRRLRRISIS
ncbi:hypothetical protein [[Clostridium] fimetarium]|uniref:hypothetical protein n=1 Tax=[Clostridium] fimetarium TaxID=99656 RepID=UPI0014818C59|nr:hypothetical protein [[Clostridium] fimetarium]